MDDETLLKLFRERLDDTNEHCGQNHLTCACGRYHFAGKLDSGEEAAEDTPEGKELAELRAKAKERPKDYVEHENEHTVVAVRVNGIDYVEECPCKWDMRMARFFITEQELIVRFIATVIAEQNKVNAVQEAIQRVVAEQKFAQKIGAFKPPTPYKGPG